MTEADIVYKATNLIAGEGPSDIPECVEVVRCKTRDIFGMPLLDDDLTELLREERE